MFITKSPMRITFLGGGTDFPAYFEKHEGATISAAINKFVYVCTNPQPSFVQDRFRFTYRKTESVNSIDEFQHPVVKAVLENLEWNEPINIATMADLPGGTGLGSSSAFTASIIQNLNARRGIELNQLNLARETIFIERTFLKEPGGWQDQIATTLAGLRMHTYSKGDFSSDTDLLTKENSSYFKKRMLLIKVPSNRKGSEPAIANQTFIQKNTESALLKDLAEQTKAIWRNLKLKEEPEDQFKILQEAINYSWEQKKKWGKHMIDDFTQKSLDRLKRSGANNFKLVGAGGSGFILVAEDLDIMNNIKEKIPTTLQVEFEMVSIPTSTKYYD